MGGKGRVITAAMLHMEYQGQIQDSGLKRRIFLIRPEHQKDVLRSGKMFLRIVDIQTLPLIVMSVGLITIYRKHWEHTDKIDTLTKYIG